VEKGIAATRAIAARGNEIDSGRECRRRHLLSHPHLLGREADEMDESRVRPANYLQQKEREPR
jgi:hypothetical protein